MDDYIWQTESPHATNEITMHDFIEYHMEEYCGSDFEVVFHDGTYAEIQNNNGDLFAVNAMGNGDFCNHKVTFERLPR